MFGVGYFKGEPHEFIMVYTSGNLRKSGSSLTFFYWTPSTSIVSVPTGTIDVPFVLNEITENFQSLTIQGQFTYRITDPKTISSILNFSINPYTRANQSEDPEKLAQRIVNEIQAQARKELQKLSLDAVLCRTVEIAATVFERMKEAKALTELGLEAISLYFTSIKPTPEMAKGLEAEYRENLLIKADEAIYRRRAIAVEKERQIKDNEFSTAIVLEQRRKELVELEGLNNLKQAEFEAKATELKLAPFKDLSHQALLALSIKEMAQNAEKIGNLTFTPEVLASLLPGK